MDKKTLLSELLYKAVRSSGAGGQHVNKVSSKVVLSFSLIGSEAFTEREKARLLKFFESRLSINGLLQISADDNRSQIRNKKIVTERFLELIEEGLKVKKYRKKSKPSRSSVIKGKQAKQRTSQKKALRKRPSAD